MRDAFVRALMSEAERRPELMLITGDLGFGVLRPFWERFPEKFINAGIAEQSMAGVAAGLAYMCVGEMVVALVEDSATVKTFYREDGFFRLQPENDHMDPIIVKGDLRILGKVIGVLRLM